MSTDQSLDVEAEQSDQFKAAASKGIQALQNQQNTDGGFGDTDRSHSNIATSYLVLAASSLASQAIGESLPSHQTEKLEQYIEKTGAFEALKERYGTDKTFVVPIPTNLAIAGIVPWDEVPALPFEAAAFPQSMYRLLLDACGELRSPRIGGNWANQTLPRTESVLSGSLDSLTID